jgi:hypothetical protein
VADRDVLLEIVRAVLRLRLVRGREQSSGEHGAEDDGLFGEHLLGSG